MTATKPDAAGRKAVMPRLMRWLRTGWPYPLLIGGSLVFLWPLVWMLMTSMKLDREMFAAERRFLPLAPAAPIRSPYLDGRLAGDAPGARQDELLRQIRAGDSLAWPAGIVPDAAEELLARSISRQSGGDERRTEITSRMIRQGREEITRQLVLGQLLARSNDLHEEVLIDFAAVPSMWKIGGPARASFHENLLNPGHGKMLSYDFTDGSSLKLSAEVELPFPSADLQRLQLFLQPDDSWHALDCEVEMDGRRFRAERRATLFDTNWLALTWQRPGPDDLSNKKKTWLLLHEAKGTPSSTTGRTLRVTLTLERRSATEAWLAKLTRNYRNITDSIPFGRYVATSLFLVVLQMAATILSCSLVAYSFARLKWPGRAACLLLMLATLMIPGQVTMIPQFLIIRQLGWYDTLLPLWVPSLGANAFYVFLLYQFMKGIPVDLEDAARIDGCGIFRIYWSVILPLLRPSLAAIGIFTFMGSWNDFMGPLIYINDQRLFPLSLGLYALSAQNTGAGSMGLMMAGSLLMTLPVVIIFLFAQRYFIQGVTLTGMKG